MGEFDPQAVVEQYYDFVDAERYDDLVALFTEDVRYERPGQATIEGRDELRTFYLEERPLTEGNHDVHDLVVDGDTVAVRGSFSGRQGGESVAFDFADFHEFSDEAIARRYSFTDRDEV
ncbi:nuclear transport factor 2 family protein [Natronorubrum sp. JWXQ-INN-674]|uniref:Nuclear transport factor 2 family protein n=1 Tax=Natronorubrum halalkaliphilum TaxID=2691917 RepID=A0A6B0VKH8_9EURY|nr:nuclear transport factor 2 family protein [Natronorubrum halalkaliphilum]MXV62351.1 nuclear transport factor 2 family protein [Natronorubrum halalkaliphilum]